MSDFDKEAERERLREKYGDDEEQRETTEQMSELLLKGATMTNAHCDNCGDPIFRYDGQEFCPTCQQPVDRGEDAGDGSDGDIEVTAPSDEATVQFGDQSADDASAAGDRPPETGSAQTDPPAAAEQPRADEQAQTEQPSEQHPERSRTQPRRAPSVDPAATGTDPDDQRTPAGGQSVGGQQSAGAHLGNAQVLLAQTVEQYARRARDTDSPREAREYLETAREAAATLSETEF